MDGSSGGVGQRSAAVLDADVIGRASQSFSRAEAHLLYRTLRAAASGDLQQVAACAADPVFKGLLTKSLAARNTAEASKRPRCFIHFGRRPWDEHSDRIVNECILRLIRSREWTLRRSIAVVAKETNTRRAQVIACYNGLVKTGAIRYEIKIASMVICAEEANGAHPQ